jgi:hypothetical protein
VISKGAVRSLLFDEDGHTDTYNYQVNGHVLSPTYDTPLCSLKNDEYTFGNTISGGCGLTTVNQLYDFYFKGESEAYNEQNISQYQQDYDFASTTIIGNKIAQWNQTRDYYRQLIVNRSLGKTSDLPVLTDATQSSHPIVATSLEDNSNLLGLQSTNATDKRDSNTYRPQLQTSYRIAGDIFHTTAIPDDSEVNDINGARAGLVRKPPNR